MGKCKQGIQHQVEMLYIHNDTTFYNTVLLKAYNTLYYSCLIKQEIRRTFYFTENKLPATPLRDYKSHQILKTSLDSKSHQISQFL